MEDDSEEVIYEFDLNTSTSKCDLFTFSTKDYPFDSHQSNTTLESIKVKPNAKQFEISLSFDKTDSIATKKNNELLIMDEKKSDLIDDKLMKVKVLKSNYLPETRIKYGVCYLSKTKKMIDIVPVDRIYDFQTDFNYMDNDDNQRKSKDRSFDQTLEMLPNLSNKSTSRSADTLHPTLELPLTPPSIELQNFTLRYESAFEYSPWSHVNYVNLKDKTSKEQWKRLKIINKSKEVKNLGRKKVAFYDESTNISKELSFNPDRCCLLPKELIIDEQSNSDLNSISLVKINQLQMSEKINRLLINCMVISFDKLISLVASDLDEELILKLLQKSAMLVQGNWVVKSEILYSNSSCEMAILHDFVSFCFTKSRELKREQIQNQIKFPLDSLMFILTRLAEFDNQTRIWRFLYPTDEKFIRDHENINAQMEISWEIRRLQIFKLILRYGADREKSNKRKPTPAKKIDETHKTIKKRLRKRKV